MKTLLTSLIPLVFLASCDTWGGASIYAAKVSTAGWSEPYRSAVDKLKEGNCGYTWKLLSRPALSGDTDAAHLVFEMISEGMNISGESFRGQDSLIFALASLNAGTTYSLSPLSDTVKRLGDLRAKAISRVEDREVRSIAECFLINKNQVCQSQGEQGYSSLTAQRYLNYLKTNRNYSDSTADCPLTHK